MNTQFFSRIVTGIVMLAVLGLSSCTQTVVYKEPPPTVVVERGPYPAPPAQSRISARAPALPGRLGARSLALERLPLRLDPRTLSPGVNPAG
jgi:hypothetical protein